MKLKNFSCNKTIFLSDLHRFWPMALLYGILLQLIIELPMLNKYYNFIMNPDYYYSKDEILAGTIETLTTGGIIPFVSCVFFVVLLFGYLNREKETYSIHAFPVSRESLFMSHYFAGLTLVMIPIILIMITVSVTGLIFGTTPSVVFIWGYTDIIIEHFFFYNLSCLVAMITGNGVMTVIVYGVLNLLGPGIQTLFWGIRDIYIYGLHYDHTYTFLDKLSPIRYFFDHYQLYHFTKQQEIVLGVAKTDIICVLLSLIPAVLFIFVAVFLYKKRNIESVGEMVVFEWGREIFRMIFTVCSSFILSIILYYILLYSILGNLNYSAQFPFMFVLVLINILLFYWLSNVILYRSIHVIKKTSFVRCGILMVIMAMVLLGTRNFHLNINEDLCDHIEVSIYSYSDKKAVGNYQGNSWIYDIECENLPQVESLIIDLQDYNQHQPVSNNENPEGFVYIHIYENYNTDSENLHTYSYSFSDENVDEVFEILEEIGTKQENEVR